MATGKNRKHIPPQGQKPLTLNRGQNNDSEYDVSSSLRKVRQYNKRYSPSETTNGQYEEDRRRPYVRSLEENYNQTQGTPTWERYDRLEDKISSYSKQNEADHNSLRRELENKIENAKVEVKSEIKETRENLDKKLSKQWYVWTIAGLVAIVGVWYMFSYYKIDVFVDDAKTKMPQIENRIKHLENRIAPDSTNAGSFSIEHVPATSGSDKH